MRSSMFYKPSITRRILKILGITIGVLLLVFLIILGVRYFMNLSGRMFINNNPKVTALDFELDPGISYQSATTDKALFFYSIENMKVIDAKGKLVEDLSLKFSNPAVRTKNNRALFYDAGGRKIVTYNGTKQNTSLELEENILLAAVNKNGYMLIVTESDMHKCSVRVLKADGKEIFKWNSGGLTVVAADIADNNKDITVSAINTDESVVKNQIIMFNISKEKPFTNDTYDGEIFSAVHYSDNHLYCVGTKNTYIYNSYGKRSGTISYNGRSLQNYALEKGLLTLVFSGSSESSGVFEIKTFNKKGEAMGSFSVLQAFDYFDVKNKTIAINNGRTISLLNDHCQEKGRVNLDFDIQDFIFFGNENKGIGITASGAVLIELK
ncbi:MAG: hypothetical protein IJF61_06135 [Clostridia bacterium]|nr:hypothetical protein [Clostridia bacterium]